MIDVKLFAPINNEKFFVGKLINTEEKILTIELDENSEMKIRMKDIAQIRLHIDFKQEDSDFDCKEKQK